MEAFTILHSSDNPHKKDKTFQTQSGLDQHKRYNQKGKICLKKDSSIITNYAVSFWQHEKTCKLLQTSAAQTIRKSIQKESWGWYFKHNQVYSRELYMALRPLLDPVSWANYRWLLRTLFDGQQVPCSSRSKVSNWCGPTKHQELQKQPSLAEDTTKSLKELALFHKIAQETPKTPIRQGPTSESSTHGVKEILRRYFPPQSCNWTWSS